MFLNLTDCNFDLDFDGAYVNDQVCLKLNDECTDFEFFTIMATQEPFSGVLGLSPNPQQKTVSFPEHLKSKKMIERNIVAIHAGGDAGGKITLGGYDKSHIHN